MKMSKSTTTTLIIIIVIIAFVIYIKNQTPVSSVDKATAQCIGERSVVYSQLGCIHCVNQKELFGDSWIYINEVVCNSNLTECQNAGITGTPTWIINGQKYSGEQSIEQLKQFTGC
ncbi:MAG: thioredoxin domain-containing protein [Nanoarchaeota archaeon]|nr:thioredoxin domain-containing protein [Nanoarchaeota archaeon]